MAPPGPDPENKEDVEMDAAAASGSPEDVTTSGAKRAPDSDEHEEEARKVPKVRDSAGEASSLSAVRRAGGSAPDAPEAKRTGIDLDGDVVVSVFVHEDVPTTVPGLSVLSPARLGSLEIQVVGAYRSHANDIS